MEIRELKNGQIIMIREATKEDSSNIITYLNEVAGETDYLSFGQGEFAFSIAEEAVSENKRAINLYKKFGFIEAGEIPALMQVDSRYLDVTMMYLVI
ncbi:hypothetical protein ACEJ07_000146 [Listeria monocytogenes]